MNGMAARARMTTITPQPQQFQVPPPASTPGTCSIVVVINGEDSNEVRMERRKERRTKPEGDSLLTKANNESASSVAQPSTSGLTIACDSKWYNLVPPTYETTKKSVLTFAGDFNREEEPWGLNLKGSSLPGW